MALIKCPECNKEISDKSEKCIHCGYPLNKQNSICLVNGVAYDLSFVLLNDNKTISIRTLMDLTNCRLIEAKSVVDEIVKTGEIPKVLTLEIKKDESINKPKCPRCNSTFISTGARGANFMFGLIGASKTVNRCANCGYTWKP